MTTLTEYIAAAKAKLASAGVENPETDVRLLVQHVTGMAHAKLLMDISRILAADEVKHLDAAIARRAAREPVSRITGTRGFWKSEFKVTPQTLDPRPDSETLIEAAVKFAQPAPKTVLDLGTGTGCLLLSLLQEWPEARGVGLDLSGGAINTARENAATLGLSSRATFVESNWENFESSESFDSVISNPPYIAPGEISGLAPEVLKYDPMMALVGGEDGLECYRSIAALLPKLLKRGGWAFFEIGYRQSEAVKSILALSGLSMIQTLPDLAGNDRVVVAKMP